MRSELQAYLDGDRSLDELPLDLQEEAEDWTRQLETLATDDDRAPA